MTIIADGFLAGSLLTLLLPTALLIALVVWYLKFLRRVPETGEGEDAAALANPGSAASAATHNPGSAAPAGGGAAPSGGAVPGGGAAPPTSQTPGQP